MIRIPAEDDRLFRADRDQLIGHPGTVITMPGMISTGEGGAGHHSRQAVSPIRLTGETGANQEIVHAQDQGSPSPPL